MLFVAFVNLVFICDVDGMYLSELISHAYKNDNESTTNYTTHIVLLDIRYWNCQLINVAFALKNVNAQKYNFSAAVQEPRMIWVFGISIFLFHLPPSLKLCIVALANPYQNDLPICTFFRKVENEYIMISRFSIMYHDIWVVIKF